MASLSGFRRRELHLGGGDGVEDLGMTALAAADGPQVGPVRLGHGKVARPGNSSSTPCRPQPQSVPCTATSSGRLVCARLPPCLGCTHPAVDKPGIRGDPPGAGTVDASCSLRQPTIGASYGLR